MVKPIHTFLTVATLSLLLGCSSAGAMQATSIEDEDVFNRTTSCVNGSLPVEIRYALLGKPTPLDSDEFNIGSVDKVSRELDPHIAKLLAAAMHRAWTLAAAKQQPWSPSFYSVLEAEYAGEIVEQAPRLLQIEFCGDRSQVGSAAFAAIAGYFSRSVTLDGGRNPKWLDSLGSTGKEKGTSIVMLAVGLRLARINFDPATLAKSAAG